MSILNAIASVAYLTAVAASLMAARVAHFRERPQAILREWLIVAGFFVFLIAIRFANLEERAREGLRLAVRGAGDYGERREFQAPLASATIVLAAIVVALAWRTWPAKAFSRERRLVMIARLAMLGYAPLYMLRIISFHTTDHLLYAGPLRLNWLIDAGLVVTVIVCALLYQHDLKTKRRNPDRHIKRTEHRDKR